MAATLVVEAQIPGTSGNNLYIGTITGDTSYPTGGYPITAPGTRSFRRLIPVPSGGYVAEWDSANQKLLFRWDRIQNAAAGTQPEVTAATNLSAVSIDFLAIGA